ncbi:S9 family peptidase [Marinicaulis flavus]|uniref:S9 family peptidase n=2 Tax=Hyphococcus luteus TaxID=2058213 RepID=A0A2S7JZT9_9PROT|nr:S9 family peptidase [Marinicaulis flavus]
MSERDPFAEARTIEAPAVEKRPVETTQHGITRVDNYAWLRDGEWQEVLRDPSTLEPDIRKVLEAENDYYAAVTGDLEPLRKKLFKEMRGRIKEDDSTIPAKDGDWLYWKKFRDGGEYPVFMRKPVAGGKEQTLYDGDAERGESAFFSIGSVEHSPDHKLAAIATDRLGSEYYSIAVRNLETGEDLPDRIESADGGGAVWTAGSDAFFYVERDDNQRPKRVKLHKLGDDPATDAVIYEEPDDAMFLAIDKSQSGDYVFITSASQVTSEVRFVKADAPDAAPQLIAPRDNGVEYYAEHHGDEFFIMTNADDAVDFKIVTAPVASPGRANWKDWLAHKAGSQIVTFTLYKDYLVRLERENALPRIVISTYDGASHTVSFGEAAYALGMEAGYEYDTDVFRFTYESPSTPEQTYDYNMASDKRTLLKTQEVPSGHDPSLYVVERIEADGEGGAKVPVTILRLKTTPKDGSAPALLYGYGSYGIASAADFSTNILSLVDRGAVFAIAHVRGGADKGRGWYLDGKLAKKMNTFTDFNASAQALIDNGYASKGRVVSYGGSAGGLLVAASVNLEPDLYGGVIAAVPFIDVINTISDADLPLTPPEWEEWGNPIKSAEEYGWIAEYSPYENIQHTDYPPIMATGGLTDYRVTYWEPAKWIARLRDDASGGPFVLRMNMGAGHGGSAARFERLDERAHLYAFALKVWGLETAEPVKHGK